MAIKQPHFGGTTAGYSSYLSLTPPPFVRDYFELKFHFLTEDANQVALLLFLGQSEAWRPAPVAPPAGAHCDFLAVSFIRGHVALTWDLGSGAFWNTTRRQLEWKRSSYFLASGAGIRRIFTARSVRLDADGGHSVFIGRKGRGAWLQVSRGLSPS